MSDMDLIGFLSMRRSVKAHMLSEPGPDAGQIETLIKLASRVPDHKKLAPWRFIVFEGDARARIGEVFAEICAQDEREAPSDVRLDAERQRFMRAPVVVAVVFSPKDKPGVPEQEQMLSTGAAGFSLCLAANAMGFGTCWLTEWIAYSPKVHATLGLADHERIAGFVYIGTANERQADRDRPAVGEIVMRWTG